MRVHEADGVHSSAVYSECEMYRYALTREWGAGKRLVFIMLNPSKATELANDPTIERCQRRAVALGFGAFRVVNLFAWRATDPRDLRAAAEPIGVANDPTIQEAVAWADQVIAAWGVHGDLLGRGEAVKAKLDGPIYTLGLTKHGHPRHPLYLRYDQQPVLWFR
ncbi:DUF1643 domain-containing protein [Yoonia sp. 2307UL14-13]|uniref:DUF1643 domain-containing protein n=1 Tax=Yoonia sp. 2307UL14-13 TaxID=3126506 RepID=UPI00309FA93E